MIYRRGQKVLVQGITGKQGSFWAAKMMECGTDVVAGVNPKRAGDSHLGVPIFRSAVEAAKQTPCDISVIFIPPTMISGGGGAEQSWSLLLSSSLSLS